MSPNRNIKLKLDGTVRSDGMTETIKDVQS